METKEDFTLIKRRNNKSIKSSSLFNLVVDLINEKHDLIQQYQPTYKLIPKSKERNIIEREVYFLRLNQKQDKSLFVGYELQDCHLSIDKNYSNSIENHWGLKPHYTEKYKNNETKKIMKNQKF